jgi:prevent-host-death family protein
VPRGAGGRRIDPRLDSVRGPAQNWSRLVKVPKTVNLYEAKTQLSKLVERAAKGEEVIIAKAGQPKARLVPLARPVKHRKPGDWKGRIVIEPDFDAPLPEDVLAAFEGRR